MSFNPWFNKNILDSKYAQQGYQPNFAPRGTQAAEQGLISRSMRNGPSPGAYGANEFGIGYSGGQQINTDFNLDQSPAEQGGGGSNIGGIVQGAAGFLDVGMSAVQMGNEAKSINTNAETSQYDWEGRPIYNQGQFAIDTHAIDPKGATGGEVLTGIGKGASAGAALGTALIPIPGLGTAIGAVGGAIVGGVSTAIGGRRRKNKMRKRKASAQANLTGAQNKFNQETEGFRSQSIARQDYNNRNNKYNRLYNIYNR